MAKITLSDAGTINQSLASGLNANNSLIEAALENTLSRDGTSPNAMSAPLDMNSHRITNLPEPLADTEPVRRIDFEELAVNIPDVSLVSDFLKGSNRSRIENFTPAYTLSATHVEGGGTDLSVQFPFDMGTHTIPTGANKQHVGIRFIGTFTSASVTETEGARAISFALTSHNCDMYGVIGSVTLASGSKGVKGIYGRAVCNSTDPDAGGDNGGVGLVGGVTIGSGSTATSAWACQLTVDGSGSLGTAANTRFISFGTDQSSKVVGYGIFSDTKIKYSTAFIRAFWTDVAQTAPFLLWQQKDGGGAGVHTDIFKCSYDARLTIGAGSVSTPGIHFNTDTDTGIYSSGANAIAFAVGGGLRFRVNANGLINYPQASATPSNNGEMLFEATSNTELTVKYKGSDGTVRTNVLTLS